MTSNAFTPNRIDTLIGAGTRIDGDIACTGVLRVQGEVKGDIQCDQKADGGLIVDGAGSIAGATSAPHIVVRGRLAGPAHSSRSIEVHDGASLVGDVSFRRLAIHAGGVVEGALSPSVEGAEPVDEPHAEAAPAGARRFPAKQAFGGAAALVVVAVAVAWAGGWLAPARQEAAPVAATIERTTELPAQSNPTQSRPETAAVVEQRAAADAANPAATPVPEPAQREDIVAVNGANPSRPAGVFLLIAHEPTVLYRKKRDDAGTGMQLSADAGEKVSISVDADELVRVAKGRALEIYFQGQKVPRDLVERGVWISFVRKPAPGKSGA